MRALIGLLSVTALEHFGVKFSIILCIAIVMWFLLAIFQDYLEIKRGLNE